MQIKWTTIESGKNITKGNVDNILKSKTKFSKFILENKKHLFGAGVSTMAMAFVVTAGQMSGTEFSADVMFPTLSQEISDTNSFEIPGESTGAPVEDISLGDLDLSFTDVDSSKKTVEDDSASNVVKNNDIATKSAKSTKGVSDTEELIDDLFGLEEKNKKEKKDIVIQNEIESNNHLNDLNDSDNSDLELTNLTGFLEDKSNDDISKMHGSAKTEDDVVMNDVKNPVVQETNNSLFKQNFNTVDMNLVAEKAQMKDSDVGEMHGSMESFFKSETSNGFSSGVNGDSLNDYEINNITDSSLVNNNLGKAKVLSQSGPEDMIFGLGFLSILLAYFFRRKKS